MHPKLALNLDILARDQGQLRSFEEGRPVDAQGAPIPWYTYPAIEYLHRFDMVGRTIFEYGCGQSTAYWSRRGARVVAVEHNADWCAEITARELPGVELMLRPERTTYARSILERPTCYDVIVIDGVWREDCAAVALERLKPEGFVILDNSDWYHEAGAAIRSRGFHEVSFSGFGPVNDYTWTTSIFFPGVLRCQDRFGPPDPIGGNPIAVEARGEFW